MKTLPGSDSSSGETKSIFEEWRPQYSTNEDRKINFGNDDVITTPHQFGNCSNSNCSLSAEASPESTPFKLKFVITRRDLIRYSKLILFTYGVLIAIEHFERIPMADEALHIARIF